MGAMWWILEEANPSVVIHHLDVGPALDPLELEETFDIPLAKQFITLIMPIRMFDKGGKTSC
jgi:hypothetical protein